MLLNSKQKISIILLIFIQLVLAKDYQLLKAQRVEVLTSDKLKIVGSFYPVQKSNAPAIILLHRLGRNRGDWNNFARYFQKEGISVLSIDLRGHGESTNFFKIKWQLFKTSEYQKFTDDLDEVFKYLVNEKNIARDRIGILGITIGGNVALKYAAKNKDIATVLLISPGLDYKGIKIQNSIKQYGERPLYIICSKNEPYALKSGKMIQAMSSGKVKLDIYDFNTTYLFLGNSPRIIEKSILGWFKTIFYNEENIFKYEIE